MKVKLNKEFLEAIGEYISGCFYYVLGWFEDKKQAIRFCKQQENVKCVFLYLGETSLLVYQKQIYFSLENYIVSRVYGGMSYE